MENLENKKCVPCEGGTLPLLPSDIAAFQKLLKTQWPVSTDGRKIARQFVFKDFKETMDFVNKVAEIAEGEGHHPDIHVHYNNVEIELTTHAIGGLSQNDFILARKIEMIH